jgi:flagellar biosynthetic protein FliR
MFQDRALNYAATWALVGARISGFVVVSPFPGAHVATTQRIGLVAALAWVASTFAPSDAVPSELGLPLVASAVTELGCGLVIGLAFRFLFLAAEVSGQLLSEAIGLSAASVLNPTIDAQDAILARVVTMIALLLALGAGVHRVAIGYLLASFRALPVGTAMSFSSTTAAFVDLAVASFVVGVQLAMPAIAVSWVVHLGLGMIARAAPALQIFSVGFSVLLVTGLSVTLSCVYDIGAGLAEHFSSLAAWLDTLLTHPSGQPP